MIPLQRTLIFILLCIPLWSKAGKIERAFEALSIYDYFNARSIFYKTIKKDSVPSAYGLSLIYGRNDNPFHHIDSARKFILIARDLYPKLSDKEKEELMPFKIDLNAIEDWKDTVDWKGYSIASKKGSILSFSHYISLHPDGKWTAKAIYKRDSLVLEEKKRQNTAEAFNSFLADYPNSPLYSQAKNKYEQALFEELSAKHSLSAYEKFLLEHPQSPFLNKVEDSIYVFFTKNKAYPTYYQFIKKHPKNRNIERAWRKLYQLYTIDNLPERIVEFRLDYPDYPFIDELVEDFALATTVFYPIYVNGKWGFANEQGKIMIEAQYDYVGPFKEGLAVAFKGDYAGYISKSNKTIIPFIYDDGEDCNQGLVSVLKEDYLGILNKLNQTVLPFEYDAIGSLNDDIILIAKNDAYGYCNRKGEIIIDLSYERAYEFSNGFAVVVDSGKYGLIDRNGNFTIPAKYKWLAPAIEGNLLRAKKDSLFGLINTAGELVLDFVYDRIEEASDSMFLIAQNGKYGFANLKGEIAIPLDFDYIPAISIGGQFFNAYAKYHLKAKYGVINKKGEKVFPAIFEDLEQYNDSAWVAVKKRGKWGYTNQQLQLVVPYQYSFAKTFIGDFSWCKKGEEWVLLNNEGKKIPDLVFEQIEVLDENHALVQSNGKWGLLNYQKGLLLACKYDKVQNYKSEYLRFISEDQISYFNKKNKKLLQF